MGGKYEIIGWYFPYQGIYDLHEFTDSWWEARRLYRKAKKMYYSAFIVRNEKHNDRKAVE
jgi:hypothetical protein